MVMKWSANEEKKLIQQLSNGKTLEELSKIHNRTVSGLELRLKKIIFENINSGKSFEQVAEKLNYPNDKVKQYYYSYGEFIEKKNKQKNINTSNKSERGIRESQSGGSISNSKTCVVSIENTDTDYDRIFHNFKKLKNENKLIRILVENKILRIKLNKLIKSGLIDSRIEGIFNQLRSS